MACIWVPQLYAPTLQILQPRWLELRKFHDYLRTKLGQLEASIYRPAVDNLQLSSRCLILTQTARVLHINTENVPDGAKQP